MDNIPSQKKPSNWVLVKLKDVAEWGAGGTPSRSQPQYFGGNIPWVKTGELGSKYIRSVAEYISEEGLQKSSARIFPVDSVGIAMYGATIGKVSIWKIDASTNQACAVAQPYKNLLYNEYLYYFLFSEKRGFIDAGKGGAQPNISQGILKDWRFFLPPIKEQYRIVAKIEELFSELDKGIESLKTAREQLKVYRQALLKHAFEGKLTEQWRKDNADKLESADDLLVRIQQERETRYQQQLDDWETAVKEWEDKGKEGKKPSKPSKPKAFDKLNYDLLITLPEIPEDWLWDKLGLMTLGVGYGTSTKSTESGEYPVLRMGNIQNTKFDWGDLVYTSNQYEIDKYILSIGDVLFNRTNSPELVGKSAIYIEGQPALFAGYLIRVNHFHNFIDSHFLNYYLNSYMAKQYGNTVKTDGVNQSNINGSKLSNYPFPYCTLLEQKEIVLIIDEQISVIDTAAIEVEKDLQRSQALRQSILKKAFSGQLVPQDPNDEPTSALLERIKAEKMALEQTRLSSRKRKKTVLS